MPISISIEQLSFAQAQDENVFARFRFGDSTDLAEYDCQTGMPLLNSESLCEVWRVPGPVTRQKLGSVRLTISDNYCLAAIELPVNFEELQQISRQAYDLIFDAIQEIHFPYIAKTWNYIPDITGGGDDDSEYYKQFCLGRALSFAEKGLTETHMPAGTAVGVKAGELLRVYVLSSKHEILPMENPRQTSAYRYPREYGPKSPSFSRAICMESDSAQQFFLSGTASIVGHVSQHVGDIRRQTLETVENITRLLCCANEKNPTRSFSLKGGIYRVHVKNADHCAQVLKELEKSGLITEQLIVVQADICRRELLVEIDGVLGTGTAKFIESGLEFAC